MAVSFVAVFLTFLYLIASYENWFGISSFGNRFFVSLTPLFVFGFAMLLSNVSGFLGSRRRSLLTIVPLVTLFVLWNIGLMFQWGLHLIPVRGSVSWRAVVYNQFVVVPGKIDSVSRSYMFRRAEMMQKIENLDIHQQESEPE